MVAVKYFSVASFRYSEKKMVIQPVKVHSFKAYDLPLDTVIVYSDRAEVKRKVNLELATGVNEVVIEGISQSFNQESVRVDGRGDAVIHEVQVQCKPCLPEESSSPKLQKLEEERKKILKEKQEASDRKEVLQKEVDAYDIIIAQVGGAVVNPPSGDKRFVLNEKSLNSLKSFFDFYESSSLQIRERLRNITEHLLEIEEKRVKVDAEINIIRNDNSYSRNISVLLESDKDDKTELCVSYQVWGASWRPSYDMRVNCSGEQTSMKMIYYGEIQQSTGEDWPDASLILSTAQPSLGGNVPELGTLNAVFHRPPPSPPSRKARVTHFLESRSEALCAGGSPSYAPTPPMAFGAMDFAPVMAGGTAMSAMFKIPRATTIPSDSSEHKVTIATANLHPQLLHETVPCKNTSVFLTAALINETSYPFLAGQAAIYFENSFVAKTDLKAVSPGERFTCSLGIDPGVKAEYKPAHKYKEQFGIISKSASVVHEQKIIIKNTKKEEVLLRVKEHLPKSTDEKIKVKLLSPPLMLINAEETKSSVLPALGVKLNKYNNLEWTLNLEPNKEVELLIKWSMEHPNEETVVFQEA